MSPVFAVTKFTKKESPEVYFMSDNSGSAAVKKKNPFLKMGASMSTTTRLMDNSDYPGKGFTASGNMRLYKNIYDRIKAECYQEMIDDLMLSKEV